MSVDLLKPASGEDWYRCACLQFHARMRAAFAWNPVLHLGMHPATSSDQRFLAVEKFLKRGIVKKINNPKQCLHQKKITNSQNNAPCCAICLLKRLSSTLGAASFKPCTLRPSLILPKKKSILHHLLLPRPSSPPSLPWMRILKTPWTIWTKSPRIYPSTGPLSIIFSMPSPISQPQLDCWERRAKRLPWTTSAREGTIRHSQRQSSTIASENFSPRRGWESSRKLWQATTPKIKRQWIHTPADPELILFIYLFIYTFCSSKI